MNSMTTKAYHGNLLKAIDTSNTKVNNSTYGNEKREKIGDGSQLDSIST